jgi:hypothetical protein
MYHRNVQQSAVPTPSPSSGRARGSAAQSDFSDEAEMDSEAVYTMAPGAAQLMIVGEGRLEGGQTTATARHRLIQRRW